jgi:hypothetical protein
MTSKSLEALVARAEHGSTSDRDFLRDFLGALDGAFPDHGPLDLAAVVSTEAAVAAVDRALPGWRIVLERAPHWHCTLRKGGSRDDDEVIGVGTAPTPALAVLTALLSVAARRARSG